MISASLTSEGDVSWVRDDYKMLASQVKATAHELAVPIRWGGDFVRFFDGPHFELERRFYPDPPVDLTPDPTKTEVT